MPKPRYEQFEFDELQIYFGEPYVIDLPDTDGKITLVRPTIGDIVRIGEKKFNSTFNIFITNTTAWRLPLWEKDIDWTEISDFQLFTMLVGGTDKDVVHLFLPEIDFSNFKLQIKQYPNSDDAEIILYDAEHGIEINEAVYQHIAQYLRKVFNSYPEEKITSDNTLKAMYIEKDKREAYNTEKKKEMGTYEAPTIKTLISSCVNHPGFKYKLSELRDVGVGEFYDSVKRLQIYEQTTACMKGLYSGFVDGSKIKPDNYNFMKNI